MDSSWVKTILGVAISLLAVGTAYGSMRGRIKSLEDKLSDHLEHYKEKTNILTKRLDKHSSELDELREIHVAVGKLEVKMDHLLDLIKEMKNEK